MHDSTQCYMMIARIALKTCGLIVKKLVYNNKRSIILYDYQMIVFKKSNFSKCTVCSGHLLRCPHKHIVNIKKVYIERNNM